MTIEVSIVPLFLIFIALSVFVIAKAGPGSSDKQRFDPKRIEENILADQIISDQERAYLTELAVLELPRRHLIC